MSFIPGKNPRSPARFVPLTPTLPVFVAALASLVAPVTGEAAPTLRKQVDQRGGFVMIGNTLGHDCGSGAQEPILGIVSGCGSNTADTSMDLLWRADVPADSATASLAITPATARTSAMLTLPPGASPTYARLYWAGVRTTNTSDTQVTFDREGGFTSSVTADVSKSALARTQDVQYVYYASADVTPAVIAAGPGSFRVGGIETISPANLDSRSLYAGWSLVVFYSHPNDPPRNLAIFDGLDQVYNSSATATLDGFIVPNSGFNASLGILAFEGDESITGDQFLFNGTVLTNALNPANNFFNGTRSFRGVALSESGDRPRLSGEAGTMSGVDLDVLDVTAQLVPGATSATISGRSSGDLYVLNAFVTAISTLEPLFSNTHKTATDVNGGELVAGDVLEYVITTSNTGTDTSEDTIVTDPLPAGVTYVPGSLSVATGAQASNLSDSAGDDRGEYDAIRRTVRVRIGAGATATEGGAVTTNDPPTTVRFRVTVNAGATGPLENQALVTAAGRVGKPQGVPPQVFKSDESGTGQDRPTIVTVTPETQLVTTPPASTNATTATFTFASNEPAATFECSLDGGAFVPCTTPRTQLGLGNGPHTFAVRARTAGAVDPTPATWTWTVDTAAPAPPVILVPAAGAVVTSTTPTISGTAEPGSTVRVTVDGGAVLTTTAAPDGRWSVTSTPLGPGPHTASASATDPAGNTSVSANRQFRVGTVGIDTTITSAPPATSSSPSATFAFTATEPGATFQCALDNGAFAACTSPRTLSGLTDGSHTFRVRAVDAFGAADPTPATHTWTVDTGGPAAPAIVSPANGSRVNQRRPVVRGTGEPGSTVTVTIDGRAAGTSPVASDGTWSVTPTADLTEGNHVVRASATDPAGNAGGTANSSFIIDLTPPDTTITQGPTGNANPTDATFTFTATEPGSIFECSLDGGSYARCSPGTRFTGLSSGAHTFAVRAIDPAGNVDPSPATRSWNVGANDGDGDGLSDEEETQIGTDPRVADTDGDGLNDGVEVRRTRTDPRDDDDDDDGLLDGHEDRNGDGVLGAGETSPRNTDTDGDGLTDGVETGLRSPEGQDTDRRTFVADADPTTSTDPRQPDTDGGSVWDGVEDRNRNGRVDTNESDPNDPEDDVDADGDGVDNDRETELGLDPWDDDSDDDGVPDAQDGLTDTDGDLSIDALDPDSDGDGLRDGTELGVTAETAPSGTATDGGVFVPDADPATTTNPKRPDTDKDTLRDGDEDRNRNGRVDEGETDPNRADTDGGGRKDGEEKRAGTDPLDPLDDYEVAGSGGCDASGGASLFGLLVLALFAFGRRRAGGAIAVAAFFSFTANAGALNALPEQAAIEVQQFHPGPGGADVLAVTGGDTPGHLRMRAGLFLNWAHEPLVLVKPGSLDRVAEVLEWQAAADVVAAIGISDWLEFGLVLPVSLQVASSNGPFGMVLGTKIDALGLGDLRLVPKATIVRSASGFGLAFALPMALPTGASDRFAGGGVASFQPRFVFDYAGARGLRVGANVGVTLRTEEHRFANVRVGHDVAWGVGARLPVTSSERPLAAVLNAYGNVQLAGSGPAHRPTEAVAALELPFGPGLAATLGVGRGLTAGYGSPAVRVIAGLTWSEQPAPVDSDLDGIFDPTDLCPTEPEDRDGFRDEDGCPDPDDDGDGVLDAADKCRSEPETKNGFQDEDGCPDVAPAGDADGDGISDDKDKCPKEAEDEDDFDDSDGCPELDNDDDGIEDKKDSCPIEQEMKNGYMDEDGCPDSVPEKDSDGDGILDDEDKCPDVAEDADGFEDEDGCPELDDDRDGVNVPADKCPAEPETINGVDDEDGCPDQGKVLVVVQAKKIVILEKVYFATGKDQILDRSFGLLKQVAQTILANPQLKKLRVEGHTDSHGARAMNMDLSQRRANNVREFLVQAGVPHQRLVAKGYGPTRPVGTNGTAKGREANRRVEFNAIDPSEDLDIGDGE